MSRSLVVAAVANVIAAGPQAAATRGSLEIRFEVQKSCTITAPVHSPRGAPISVDCTKGTPYYVEIVPPATSGEIATVTVHY